jgi:hypothetical protein
MMSVNDWGLKFLRWGMGLSVVGLVTGYLPLGHYLMKDALPSCPAAPVHGHTILLSFVGMSLFGLIYRTIADSMESGDSPLALIRLHFWLAVIGTIGVAVNGTIGYEILSMTAQPHFYYNGPQGQAVRNLWFGVDGLFLTIYGIGCAILLYLLITKTSYGAKPAAVR